MSSLLLFAQQNPALEYQYFGIWSVAAVGWIFALVIVAAVIGILISFAKEQPGWGLIGVVAVVVFMHTGGHFNIAEAFTAENWVMSLLKVASYLAICGVYILAFVWTEKRRQERRRDDALRTWLRNSGVKGDELKTLTIPKKLQAKFAEHYERNRSTLGIYEWRNNKAKITWVFIFTPVHALYWFWESFLQELVHWLWEQDWFLAPFNWISRSTWYEVRYEIELNLKKGASPPSAEPAK